LTKKQIRGGIPRYISIVSLQKSNHYISISTSKKDKNQRELD